MITIKSFTDVPQSKTLSTILPVETADMWYQYIGINIKDGSEKPIHFPVIMRDCKSDKDIPCWSLAALLNILPNKICLDNETYYLNCNKEEVKYLGPVTCDGQKSIVSASDNLLDGCYKMIRTLHELKLL